MKLISLIATVLVFSITPLRADDTAALIKKLEARIAALEAKVAKLESSSGKSAASSWSKLHKGMTEDEVRETLGKPGLIEEVKGGGAIWHIGKGKSGTVTFGADKLVKEWQAP